MCLVYFIPGTILEHPTSVTVTVGEWANFNCSVNCSETVSLRWRLAAPMVKDVNEHYYKIKRLQKMWRREEITIKHESTTSESTGCQLATLQVLATSQMNGAVIQCASISTRNSVSSSYSRFAVMQVQPLPDSMGNTASNRTTAAGTSPPS